MEERKLWEKIVCVTFWTLITLLLLAGALGGLVYFVKEIILK